ncbi:MAG: ribonuclease R, partial [Marinoscillum sp.]
MSKKRKKLKGGKPQKNTAVVTRIKDQVRAVFANNLGERYSYRQMIKALGLRDKKSKEALKDILFGMESKGKIEKAPDGRFISAKEAEVIEGRVDHVNSRFAYIISPESEDDIWVKSDDLKFAIDHDTVKVQITKPSMSGFRPEGKVVEVVSRAKDEFVGRIEVSEKYSFVVPDNKNIHFDVMVYPEKIKKAKHNDKVIVKITKWLDAKNRSPLGDVIDVLGPAGENEAEIHS